MLDAAFQKAYPLAMRAVRARQTAAMRVGWPSADLPDLEQELLIRVWQALLQYDPTRSGLRTFIEMVVASRMASMLRTYRSRPEFGSLNEGCFRSDDWSAEIDLRTDVRRVLAGVDPLDRAVAFALGELTVADASRDLGISRHRIYDSIGRLRDALAAGGCVLPGHDTTIQGDTRSG
jgi:RNA polymerase sigma factor (sigma-70 family)